MMTRLDDDHVNDDRAFAQFAPPVPAIVRPPVETVVKLDQITMLHAQGILTDDEFALARAQLVALPLRR